MIRRSGSRLARWATVCAAVALAVGVAAPSVAGASAHKSKRLSLSTITFGGGFNGDFNLAWIAYKAGFFKKAGLNVNFLNVATGNADVVAGAIANAYQFVDTAYSGPILSVQQGSPLRAFAHVNVSAPETAAISTSAAAAHNIPQTATTPAQAKAQFLALKGSHLTLGVSNTTALSYNVFVALAKTYGITFNTPGADVQIQSLGSVNALTPALQSGKIDGFLNSPPTTVVTGAIEMPYWMVPPFNTAMGILMLTTTSVINAHPDTVQAVADGLAQAAIYAKQHPLGAERMAIPEYAQIQITSPEEVEFLYADLSVHWSTILISKASYNLAVRIINLAQPANSQITIPYSTFVVPRFAIAAVKKYGPVPKK